MERVGVIHGRFQPVHVGHLEYLLAGKQRCDMLVVGITNPDPWTTTPEASDPNRGAADANPFTFYERYLLIEAALLGAGIDGRRFRIVPFPHSFPERLHHYAPRDALYLLSIYGEWGETKLRRFTEIGLRTEVLWRRRSTVTSGTEVRRRIAAGEPWRHLVPAGAAERLLAEKMDERLRGTRP